MTGGLRPDYVGQTKEEAHLGQNLPFCFSHPLLRRLRSGPGASFAKDQVRRQ
jgi:hypothetical protein